MNGKALPTNGATSNVQLLENFNRRLDALEMHNQEQPHPDWLIRWPQSTPRMAQIAGIRERTGAHAKHVIASCLRVMGPQVIMMLEGFAEFFSNPNTAEFWTIWDRCAELLETGSDKVLERISIETEAMELNIMAIKIKHMVMSPITFNQSNAVDIIMSILPTLNYMFGPKSSQIIDTHAVLRSILGPQV